MCGRICDAAATSNVLILVDVLITAIQGGLTAAICNEFAIESQSTTDEQDSEVRTRSLGECGSRIGPGRPQAKCDGGRYIVKRGRNTSENVHSTLVHSLVYRSGRRGHTGSVLPSSAAVRKASPTSVVLNTTLYT